MGTKSYSKLNAFLYELINFVSRFWKDIKNNKIVRLILKNCHEDWIDFRTEIVMTELDSQVKEIHAAWDREEELVSKPIYIEEEPDGSEAQKLLGGPIRVTSWWASHHDNLWKRPPEGH